jgi:hypothetical protein
MILSNSEYNFYADSNYDLLWYNVLLESSYYNEAFNLCLINKLIKDVLKVKLIPKEINRTFMENNLIRHNALDDEVALKIAYKNIK